MSSVPQHDPIILTPDVDGRNYRELQSRLAAIVESADDAIITKSLDGAILSWNRGAERMFGYKAEEVLGKHISMLAAPDRVDEIPRILERLSRGERIDHYETRRKTKDGRILTVCLTISPIRDASGQVIAASKIARDVSEVKRATELQERLAAIVESSDDAIISKDLNGIIQSWNRGAERIFGYTAHEMIGKHISTIAAPDRVDEIPEILARIARGERIEHYETKRRTKDGRILTMSLTISPLRDASGAIIGASKIGRDITEQKRLAELQGRLAAIVESADDAIVSKSLDGTILSWNRGAERMFGYKAEEVVGKHISMLAAPDRVHEIPRILERLSRGERIDHHETRRKTKDGRILTVSLTISPIRDASGQVIAASKIARDITEVKRATELQERLAAIVESSDDAIISKNLDGIIQSWNRGAERIFGYTAEEMIGKHISTIAAPDRLDEIPEILGRIARGERIEHYQTKRRTKDGRILTMSLTVSPIRDASGTIIGASKIGRDVTQQERHREELEQANAALTRSNHDLQQFAYSASHDLREPLRMVSTYGGMLRRKFGGNLGETGDLYIQYIIGGAERMQKLIDDLLAFTRVSVFDQAPPEEIDANVSFENVLANLRAAISSSGASVTRSALPRVRLHPFQMEQLLQNLIGNAIRYRGEEPPRIHVAAEKNGEHWQFSVQDNGIGIDPQYQEQIFEIFKRLHSASEYPGTGMGLAICERIVQRAGGRIWVESEAGRGATFFFTLRA